MGKGNSIIYKCWEVRLFFHSTFLSGAFLVLQCRYTWIISLRRVKCTRMTMSHCTFSMFIYCFWERNSKYVLGIKLKFQKVEYIWLLAWIYTFLCITRSCVVKFVQIILFIIRLTKVLHLRVFSIFTLKREDHIQN
jgi:hypothetical protein